jgi:RNA polymerase sigma factor (sigma-70 family)
MSDENEIYVQWQNAIDDEARGRTIKQLSKEVRRHGEAVVWEGLNEWNPDTVEKIVAAVVDNLPRFQGRSKFSTWVHAIGKNKVKEELRYRKNRRKDIDETARVEDSEDGGRTPRHEVRRPDFDTPMLVDDLCKGLSEENTLLLQGKYEQMSSDEIGQLLGISADAVDSRWARLKPTIQEKFRGSDGKATPQATN